MGNITIFHGSPEIREKPVYGLGKKYNDYGQGFYCTQNIELAKEWACMLVSAKAKEKTSSIPTNCKVSIG